MTVTNASPHGWQTLHPGPTSAECVRDIFDCHFPDRALTRDGRGGVELLRVLDLTYGQGTFWKWDWQAKRIELVTNDFFTEADYRWDLRPFTDPTTPLPTIQLFDVVVFDPPHLAIGTPSKGGEWAQRYGAARNVPGAPHNYEEILALTIAGTRLALRMATQGVIVKTQPAVESGRWGHSPYYVEREIIEGTYRFQIDGWWLMDTSRRPQPSGRTQEHPRNTLSVFYVAKAH